MADSSQLLEKAFLQRAKSRLLFGTRSAVAHYGPSPLHDAVAFTTVRGPIEFCGKHAIDHAPGGPKSLFYSSNWSIIVPPASISAMPLSPRNWRGRYLSHLVAVSIFPHICINTEYGVCTMRRYIVWMEPWNSCSFMLIPAVHRDIPTYVGMYLSWHHLMRILQTQYKEYVEFILQFQSLSYVLRIAR